MIGTTREQLGTLHFRATRDRAGERSPPAQRRQAADERAVPRHHIVGSRLGAADDGELVTAWVKTGAAAGCGPPCLRP
jgi:hypothetical protein